MVASAAASGVWLLEPPLLVVEVLSPSTRGADLGYKLEAYPRHGAQWYWVVDPARSELAVFRANSGAFVEVQHLTTAAPALGPVVMTVDPQDLCR